MVILMRFKKSLIFGNTTPLENEIVQILWIYERADANIDQVWLGVNHYSKRKYLIHKPSIKEAIISLVNKGIVIEKEYTGGLKHYLLKDYFTNYKGSMNE